MSEHEFDEMDRLDVTISEICGGYPKEDIINFIEEHQYDPDFGITDYYKMKKVLLNENVAWGIRKNMLEKLRDAIVAQVQESKSDEQRAFEHVMRHPVLYGSIAGIGFGLASGIWDDMWNQNKNKD